MLLTVLQRKALRKWRNRAFMLTQNALDRLALSRQRILFTRWPDAEHHLRWSFQYFQHEIAYGDIASGRGYDVVIPLSIEGLLAAGRDESLIHENPLPIPRAEVIEICDDKAKLNAVLREHGFGRHVADDVSAGTFPYILKRSRDANSRHAFRIAIPADEAAHSERIASADYLRQEWIDGATEFTTHLLIVRGQVRRALTVSYEMRNPGAIRGRDALLLHQRCRSRHVPLFAAMLRVIGFEGICCTNFKERDGVPVLFEINPRFGYSLAPYFATFVRHLDWGRRQRS